MSVLCNSFKLLCIGIIAMGIASPSQGSQSPRLAESGASISALWRDPGEVEALDLFYGPGSAAGKPAGVFTFVQEVKDGATPKFEVVDERGLHWIAKVGEEAKSETAATRLVWAAGYFTDETYFVSDLRVAQMPKLSRGREFVSDGVARNVRLEPMRSGQKKVGEWAWSENPLVGTREMNGLRIMMALINNWDLRSSNNAIYSVDGAIRYMVSDLGASFGKTGGVGSRTKNKLEDYAESEFIDKADLDVVDLNLKTRPFFLLAVDPYHYNKFLSKEKVGRDIPREHARWLGQLLSRLSVEQIRDCFRAAGYSPTELDGFAQVVQRRIADLKRL